MKFARPATAHGFTLIEVMISAALMALILVSAYMCLDAGLKGQKIVEPQADILQNARVAMALITADLRNACPLPGDSQFLGMQRLMGEVEADNLDFATHNYTPRRDHEGDFCEVSYYVGQDPQTHRYSLWRRRNPTLAPDPLAGGNQEEIAQDILGVRFEYFDGLDWYDSWGQLKSADKAATSLRQQNNLQGLPAAVRVTLMLDSSPQSKPDPQTGERVMEPPVVFQTVACLNLASMEQNNDTGGGDNSTSGNQNGGQN